MLRPYWCMGIILIPNSPSLKVLIINVPSKWMSLRSGVVCIMLHTFPELIWTFTYMQYFTCPLGQPRKRQKIARFCELIRTCSGNSVGSWFIFLCHIWILNGLVKFDLDTIYIINDTTILVHGRIRPYVP